MTYGGGKNKGLLENETKRRLMEKRRTSKRWRKNKKFTYGEQAIDRWRNNEATGGGGDDIK